MEKAVKNQTPIVIDLWPNQDVMYSGICLKFNDDIFIFICFNEDSKEFDGYAIIRNYEIEKYRVWDKEELSEIKNNNFLSFTNVLPLEKMNSMFESLYELKGEELIAIFTESDDDSYFVGRIENLSKNELKLKLINEDGEWINSKTIKINTITYIGFRSRYENDLLKKNLC